MNALLKTLFTILLVGCMFGCSNRIVSLKDEIAPKELTDDQKEIVELLLINKQEILFFDYKTQEPYKSAEFWVEIYQEGVLVSRPAGLHRVSNEFEELNGNLAVLITQNPGFQWLFNMNGASHVNSVPIFVDDSLARGYVPLGGPIAIQDGKEIVLYISVFSFPKEGAMLAMYSDLQRYAGHPELIKDYPYVHLIKCKFSK